MGGMTNQPTTTRSRLPHHKLIAHAVARELLQAVKDANVRDSKLNEHAMNSAKSACLNTAEGAGRVTRRDKARAFAIARGEAVEAVAAVEIAALGCVPEFFPVNVHVPVSVPGDLDE